MSKSKSAKLCEELKDIMLALAEVCDGLSNVEKLKTIEETMAKLSVKGAEAEQNKQFVRMAEIINALLCLEVKLFRIKSSIRHNSFKAFFGFLGSVYAFLSAEEACIIRNMEIDIEEVSFHMLANVGSLKDAEELIADSNAPVLAVASVVTSSNQGFFIEQNCFHTSSSDSLQEFQEDITFRGLFNSVHEMREQMKSAESCAVLIRQFRIDDIPTSFGIKVFLKHKTGCDLYFADGVSAQFAGFFSELKSVLQFQFGTLQIADPESFKKFLGM